MTDIYDQAAKAELFFLSLARQEQEKRYPTTNVHYSHCMDCGEQIDPERIAAVKNCRRCVMCVRAEEVREKLFTR